MNRSPLDEQTQAERFADVAHAPGCDEDEAAFKAKLTVIAKQQPKGKKLSAETKKVSEGG